MVTAHYLKECIRRTFEVVSGLCTLHSVKCFIGIFSEAATKMLNLIHSSDICKTSYWVS